MNIDICMLCYTGITVLYHTDSNTERLTEYEASSKNCVVRLSVCVCVCMIISRFAPSTYKHRHMQSKP